MNRDFVYDNQPAASWSGVWARAGSTLNRVVTLGVLVVLFLLGLHVYYAARWLWGAFCCGLPGVPCYFCNCCERLDDAHECERQCANQIIGNFDDLPRPHRPNTPTSRKFSPATRSAVRYALSQLQGEPAPPPPPPPPPRAAPDHKAPEPG